MIQYYPKAIESSGGNIKLALDLSRYIKKSKFFKKDTPKAAKKYVKLA